MSKRTQELAPDAAWTKGNLPAGMITVADKPMLFWLPDGVELSDIGLVDDDSDQTPFDDESGLVDDEVAA